MSTASPATSWIPVAGRAASRWSAVTAPAGLGRIIAEMRSDVDEHAAGDDGSDPRRIPRRRAEVTQLVCFVVAAKPAAVGGDVAEGVDVGSGVAGRRDQLGDHTHPLAVRTESSAEITIHLGATCRSIRRLYV